MPSTGLRTSVVLHHFAFELALLPLSSVPRAGISLRAGSPRKRRVGRADSHLPRLFRGWHWSIKAQAVELHALHRTATLLAREHASNAANP